MNRRGWLKWSLGGILAAVCLFIVLGVDGRLTVLPLKHGFPRWASIGEAVAKGDLADVKRHLGCFASIDQTDEQGNTLLHLAAASGRNAVAQYLAARMKDINAPNGEGETPLHLAAARGKSESERFLVESGADGAARDRHGRTPLHHACMDAAVQEATLVRFLIESGCAVDARGDDGWTPLHLAARASAATDVTALLGKGARFDLKIDEGDFPVDLAYRNHLYEEPSSRRIVKTLLDAGSPCNLHQAVLADDRVKAKAILADASGRIDARDREGWTALHVAAYHGRYGLVDALVKAGADLEAGVWNGRTPLMFALMQNQNDTARALISLGANVRARTRADSTVLHQIGGEISRSLVKHLLDRGADGSAVNKQGQTPLHRAALLGRTDLVELYLRGGGRSAGAGYSRPDGVVHCGEAE